MDKNGKDFIAKKRKHLGILAGVLASAGIITAFLWAGTEDFRRQASEEQKADIASKETTNAMWIGSMISMAGAIALLKKRDKLNQKTR